MFLALVDTLLLYIRAGNTWISSAFHVDITQKILGHSTATCQVYSFISNFLLQFSPWLLFTLVAEATLLVMKPMRAHKRMHMERAQNTILIQILFLVCVNAHFFWTYGLEEDFMTPNHYFCTFSTLGSYYSEYFRDSVWPIMDLLVSSILPGIGLIACVAVITHRKYKTRSEIRTAFMENGFLLHPESTESLVTCCLVVAVSTLILTLPEFGYNFFEFFIEAKDLYGVLMMDIRFDSKRRLAQAVCLSIRDAYLALKILIYFLSWRTFRRQLIRLLKRKRKDHEDDSMRSTTMASICDSRQLLNS